MYTPPVIYQCARALTREMLRSDANEKLGWTYDATVAEMVQAANKVGDEIDPDTIIVRIVVEGRAL
jgi:hypothetical protein